MPVMGTGKLVRTVTVAVHARSDWAVALAAIVTGVGLKGWQDRPDGTTSVNAILPAKFWMLVSVMVEVNVLPELPLGEVALMEKSPTWTVALAACEAVPLAAVPVTLAT